MSTPNPDRPIVDAPPGTCPPWCTVALGHPYSHTHVLGTAEGVAVHLTDADASVRSPFDGPQVWLHHGTAAPDPGLFVPAGEACSLAAVLAALGHGELAALVRRAVETAHSLALEK